MKPSVAIPAGFGLVGVAYLGFLYFLFQFAQDLSFIAGFAAVGLGALVAAGGSALVAGGRGGEGTLAAGLVLAAAGAVRILLGADGTLWTLGHVLVALALVQAAWYGVLAWTGKAASLGPGLALSAGIGAAGMAWYNVMVLWEGFLDILPLEAAGLAGFALVALRGARLAPPGPDGEDAEPSEGAPADAPGDAAGAPGGRTGDAAGAAR